MDPKQAKSIFLRAVEEVAPSQWPGYLDEVCGDDTSLRHGVELLLAAHQEQVDLTELGRAVWHEALPTVDQPLAECPGTQIGPYQLLEQLGEGGMGVVFLAEQREPVSRQVALKVIKPGLDTRRVIDRFEAERLALAVMDHPHVAKVLDAGSTPGGRPYFVMELVRGVPITRYCDDHELSIRQRLKLFLPVCQAVQHAHQKGIIHRDLKPSNILVAEFDGRPVPKVIDFGVAKAVDQGSLEKTTFTREGQVVGTPEYMSPEQAQSHTLVDTRSDVYSLGVVLYELLTGDTPLDRRRLRSAAWDEIMRMIREEDPPTPSAKLSSSEALPSVAAHRHIEPARLRALVRGELDWIVMKALDKDRTRRYESPSALARDIEHHLHDQPVLAGPPSAGYRFRKFARRNKRILATVGLIALAMIVGTAVSVYQAVRATRAERQAETWYADLKKQSDALKEAVVESDNQRNRAESNLHLAMIAIEDLLMRLAADRLRNVPQLHGLRVEMADHAVDLLEQLSSQNLESLVIRRSVARGYLQLGQLYSSIGQNEDSEESLRKAIELMRPVAAAHDADGTLRMALADSCKQLGSLLRHVGRLEEAEAAYRERCTILLAVQDDGIMNEKLERLIADSHHDVGRILADRGDHAAAEQAYRRAVELLEGLSLANSTSANRYFLAVAHFNLGELQFQTARLEEGEAHTRTAVTLLRENVNQEAAVQEYRQFLAVALNNLGMFLYQSGQTEEAHDAFQEHVDILAALAADYPEMPDYRGDLAVGYGNIAALLRPMGRRDEAEQAARAAVKLLETLVNQHPEVPVYRVHLATYTNNLGNCLRDNDELESAISCFRRAVALNESLVTDNPQMDDYKAYWARHLENLGRALEQNGQFDEGRVVLERAIDTMLSLIDRQTADGAIRHSVLETTNNLAHHLATCADPMRRDPAKAVQLAAVIVRALPQRGVFWNTLGLAQYRTGDWPASIESFTRSMQLRQGGDAHDFFFLAMAHHQLNHADEALQWYERGVQWMENTLSSDSELRRIREEAAALLQITP
jgi:eukaryotic-like serine/threonine-protein kinase